MCETKHNNDEQLIEIDYEKLVSQLTSVLDDKKITSQLTAINEKLKTIFLKLDEIDKTLHGNGRKGLVERVTTLETQASGAGKNVTAVGWIITTLIAMYAAFFKHTN